MQNLVLTKTGLVDKTPLLWSPIAFGPGVRTGSTQVITFREKNSSWSVEADYRSGY